MVPLSKVVESLSDISKMTILLPSLLDNSLRNSFRKLKLFGNSKTRGKAILAFTSIRLMLKVSSLGHLTTPRLTKTISTSLKANANTLEVNLTKEK